MAGLRWILLVAGLVFLAALTLWELRRPRQGRGGNAAAPAAPQRTEPTLGSMDEESPARASVSSSRPAFGSPSLEGRRRIVPPLQVDMPPLAPSYDEAAPVQVEVLPVFDYYAAPEADTSASQPPAPDEEPPEGASAPRSPATPMPLVVDWPPDGERRIVAFRIVPGSEERLSGREVRLAICACGFVHGRFGIYHQPGVDGRSLLSVASLSKPGILDPENLDFQRLSGINLFTVLPGPLPSGAALDHLFDTARELAQRLQARLQDEHGQPLDAQRLETLRDGLQGLDAEPAA
jgi:FtsZ-interacting cell division protein ZipA